MAIQSNPEFTMPIAIWRSGLPMLHGSSVTLRELRMDDTQALLQHLVKPQVLHYIAPSPSTADGFRHFIGWAQEERRRGAHVCFGIVPVDGLRPLTPVGIIQIWSLERNFATAEWGFVIDDAYWGKGLFVEAAKLALDFAFGVLNVHRLEARAACENGRGNGVLRKLGATREGVLRSCFQCNGEYVDHAMWSLLDDEWAAARSKLFGAT